MYDFIINKYVTDNKHIISHSMAHNYNLLYLMWRHCLLEIYNISHQASCLCICVFESVSFQYSEGC